MTTMRESDRPFFSRTRTKLALDSLEQAALETGRLLVYGGAGVTIDRSSLNWRGMVDGLLSQYVLDPTARQDIFEESSILETASLAIEYFRKDYGDHYRERIADRLRVMLYMPGDWQAGALAANIASLAVELGSQGIGYVVATPNYDDYLAEALSLQLDGPLKIATTVAQGTEGGLVTGKATAADWLDSPGDVEQMYSARNVIVQLHGLIPRNSGVNKGAVIPPVIGELDYFGSERYTYKALRALLEGTPALFVGTSLTDRPLLQALADTLPSSSPRFAVVPVGLRHEGERDRQRGLRAAMLERFQHFGVIPIYVDYYFQIAQFVDELARLSRVRRSDRGPSAAVDPGVDSREGAIGRDDAADEPFEHVELEEDAAESDDDREEIVVSSMEDPGPLDDVDTYGQRLRQWAQDWSELQEAEPDAEQLTSMLTSFALKEVRSILDVSSSEITKLELWVRDDPTSFRGLRLYASSVSRHLQEASARRALFSNDSRISAIRAFVAGRPIVASIEDGASPNQRWRTYLSLPIRLKDADGIYGRLPVGALVLASMREISTSGIVREYRRSAMHEATEVLVWLGETLTDTDPEMWRLTGEGDSNLSEADAANGDDDHE